VSITTIGSMPRGYTALVSSDGDLHTRVNNVVVVEVTQVLETRRPAQTATVTHASVAATSGNLVSARSGRQRLVIQNQGAQMVHINPAGGTATTSDMALAPGASLTIDASVEGAVTAISATGTVSVAVWEFE
jgi:hypothetical protein